jgi:RNA polymerase sigma-70 factor (ECF subfamily)
VNTDPSTLPEPGTADAATAPATRDETPRVEPGVKRIPQRGSGRARFSDNESDLALLARISHGDRDALREMYTVYYHPLRSFIHRITGQLDLADEGVNDAMLVVWSNASRFAHRSSVSTWIMGIAYRKALKLLARKRRWMDRFASVDFDAWIEHSGPAVDPSDHADLRDLLDQALKRLSPEHRAVVELTYFYGCSYEEIAVIAGCPVNTVKTRMFYARTKLRGVLPRLGKDWPST